MTSIQIPLISERNVYKDLLFGLVHQIITINVDAIASVSVKTLGIIDIDGSVSPDSCECFLITMNNGEKFYCAVNVFLKHQSEILQSIKTTDIRGVYSEGVRKLFDIESLRKTV
jgi:hypothetical protein